MAKAVVNEDYIMKELDTIIAWMVALGLPARNSRYARYQEHINKFYRSGAALLSEEGNQSFKELSQAYRECIDIYIVYKCFEHVKHPNFIASLSKVVAGRDVPDLESAGESRNFLFELLVAARFHLAGYAIDFDETSDVVAKRDGLVVRAECKRLVSEKQLEKRVNYAANQLALAAETADEEAIGIVYIDVSSCILSDVRQVVGTRDEAEQEINTGMRRFVIRNANLLETLNRKHIDVSYATCLVGTLPIWSRDFVLHTSASTAVRAAETLNDEKYGQLKQVLTGFDETFTRLF
ncbi:hypothetical protein [Massilia consociata]|uniref:Restriction endonuclease n=1 Tax=Massilia consociata TaxID=760117 RepID=A0ABV6FH82_9BURK